MKTIAIKRTHHALMFFVVLAGAVLLALTQTGCSTMNTLAKATSAAVLNASSAIEYGVMKVAVSQENPQAAAAKIIDIATEFKDAADAGSMVTVDHVRAELNRRLLGLGLDEADLFLARKLVAGIGDELDNRISVGSVAPDVRMAVHEVADIVIGAAALVL